MTPNARAVDERPVLVAGNLERAELSSQEF